MRKFIGVSLGILYAGISLASYPGLHDPNPPFFGASDWSKFQTPPEQTGSINVFKCETTTDNLFSCALMFNDYRSEEYVNTLSFHSSAHPNQYCRYSTLVKWSDDQKRYLYTTHWNTQTPDMNCAKVPNSKGIWYVN